MGDRGTGGLALATVVVTAALLLRLFPSWTAWLLQQL